MSDLSITLYGRIPSKKNSRIMIFRKGLKPLSIPSAKYSSWHKEASKQLLKIKKPEKPIEFCTMQLDFYFPDNRTKDLTNAAESIMDLLVDCDILFDDSWQVVSNLDLIARGIDRKTPRCVITINEL